MSKLAPPHEIGSVIERNGEEFVVLDRTPRLTPGSANGKTVFVECIGYNYGLIRKSKFEDPEYKEWKRLNKKFGRIGS